MKLEVGKSYKARNGEVYKIISKDDRPSSSLYGCYEGMTNTPIYAWFEEDGAWAPWNGVSETDLDLVEEVK